MATKAVKDMVISFTRAGTLAKAPTKVAIISTKVVKTLAPPKKEVFNATKLLSNFFKADDKLELIA